MQSNPFDEELSFKDCIGFLLRNKKIILIFSFVGLLFAIYNSNINKAKWVGEIQIVLSEKSEPKNNLTFLNPIRTNNQLTTQLEILKSPSVLIPVYDFLNAEKLNLDTKYKKPNFKGWLESNLDIDLIEGTSVLKLKYKDSEKSLIIPVLTKISEEYKQYPYKSNINTKQKQLKNLEKIIENAKKRSMNSFSKTQEYSNKNNIYIVNPASSVNGNRDSLNITTNIEVSQSRALNKINEIDNNLKIIESLDVKNYGAQLIFSLINNQTLNNLNNQLIETNNLLIEKQNYLTPNDEEIIAIKKLINSQKSFIKRTSIEILKGERQKQLESLNYSISQKDKIYKFKMLYKNSVKDDELLSNLEKEYLALELKKLSLSDPWEIITNPTLFDNPINEAPKIYILNILVTTSLGIILSILMELYKDKIYDNNTLNTILKGKLKTKIYKFSNNSWENELNYLTSIYKDLSKISFIIINEEIDSLKRIKDILYKTSPKKELRISENLNDIFTLPNPLVFISEGITNISKLKELINKENNDK